MNAVRIEGTNLTVPQRVMDGNVEAPAPGITPVTFTAATFGLFWITLLMHEAAHFGMLGVLKPTSHPNVVVVSAGPVVTALIIIGTALYSSTHSGLRATQTAVSIVWGAASRIVLVGPGILLGTAINDERTVAQIVGVSARLLWAVELLIVGLAVYYVTLRLPSGTRGRTLLSVAIGILLGWVSAFTLGRAIGLPI
jgi:hypothetical protein